MAEADRRGILPPEQKALFDEAKSRGLVPGFGSTTDSLQDNTILNKLAGGGHAALAMATGATTGLLGRAGGMLGGIAGSIATGEYGTQEGAARASQSAEEGAQKLTTTPNAKGAEYLQSIGRILDASKLAGLGPTEAIALSGSVPAVLPAKAKPAVNAPVELLNKEGVSLTPGQIKGGVVKRMEDAATSIPLLGDAIKAAQRRGNESVVAAALNRGLAQVGEKLPNGMTGNKAVDYAYRKLGDAYDALLPNLRGDLDAKAPSANALPATGLENRGMPVVQGAGASLREDLANIRAMGENLPQPQRGQLDRIIDKEVLGRFTPQGKASGETLKEIESQLGALNKVFKNSENYDVRTLGGAVKEIQNSLRRMVERVNPENAGELSKINEGYANFKIAQKAASNSAAREGVFSPAQLHSAVRAKDTSKDKARFAEGNARLQDLSSASKAVLPSSVPDSGTPLRGALMYALTHPLGATALSIPAALGALPYTPMGQGVLQRLMMRHKEVVPRSSIGAGTLEALLAELQNREKVAQQ